MNLEKWEKLSLAAQMGNIGSEINRVIYWNELGDKEEMKNSLWRVLELIDLTIVQRKRGEISRLREVICDIFLDKNNYKVSTKNLKEYFLNFALLAKK